MTQLKVCVQATLGDPVAGSPHAGDCSTCMFHLDGLTPDVIRTQLMNTDAVIQRWLGVSGRVPSKKGPQLQVVLECTETA